MKPSIKMCLTAACIVAILGAFGLWLTGRPSPLAGTELATEAAPPRCGLKPGEQAAFQLRSWASAEGLRDHFDAVMSWQVLEVNQGVAKVRAGLSDVDIRQEISAADQQATTPEGLAFFLEVGPGCEILSKGYSSQWEGNAQLLVSTLLDNFAFTLPAAASTQWHTQASDGLGDYRAKFTRVSTAPWQIHRSKSAHKVDAMARAFGIDFHITQASATATFDSAQPLWWQRIEGSETVIFTSPNAPDMPMAMAFSLQRDNRLFKPVPELAWAARVTEVASTALATNSKPLASLTTHQSYPEVREAFRLAYQHQPPRYYDAALALGVWLQQHPEDIGKIVAELRAGADTNTHPTLFHALQLSANQEAKQALADLMADPSLSAADQARAASALADTGEPSQTVADLLLNRAQINDLAGDVSLLSLGSLSARSQETELRSYVGQALLDHHAATDSEAKRGVLLQAMGNSGDKRFAPLLREALHDSTPSRRRHAARALAKLPAEQAKPLLLQRLAIEGDERTATEVIKALADTRTPATDALPIVAQRLQHAGNHQRAALIQYLGAQDDKASQQLLAKHFKQEPSAKLKQLIGQYLPAEALR